MIFKPAAIPLSELKRITLQQDELEAVRLCDGEGLTQEEAGVRMEVSRGTVQRLVTSGREKIIRTIVDGQAILIPYNAPAESKKQEEALSNLQD